MGGVRPYLDYSHPVELNKQGEHSDGPAPRGGSLPTSPSCRICCGSDRLRVPLIPPIRDHGHRSPLRLWQGTVSASRRDRIMKQALIYLAIALALATGITATVVFQPDAAFAECATGDCSG